MRQWMSRHGDSLTFVASIVIFVLLFWSFDIEDARYTPLILIVGAFGLMFVRDPLVASTAVVPCALLYGITLLLPPAAAAPVAIAVYVYGVYFLVAPEDAAQRWSRLVLRRRPSP